MKVLMVGSFSGRESNASALRVRGVACALERAGHSVLILDHYPGAPVEGESWSLPGLGTEEVLTGISIDEYAAGLGHRLSAGMRGIFLGDVAKAYIETHCYDIDAILLYGTHAGYLLRLRELTRQRAIPLLLDVVEWYAPEDLPGGRFGPISLCNSISMRCLSLNADGFIVISQRLKTHYEQSGKPLTLIPPLFAPVAQLPEKSSAHEQGIHICFAGALTPKDAIEEILMGLLAAADSPVPINMHLIGMTEEQVARFAAGAKLLNGSVGSLTLTCHGWILNRQARERIGRSDFSLLARPLRRSNQYGFPSKLAESMALGTPLIANLFSDLNNVLIDGKNAVVLPELKAAAIADGLRRAARMPAEQRRALSAEALRTAHALFSPDNYVESLTILLHHAVAEARGE